ncbi:MAG: peptide deformylase, partial [Patescibacteria group bacterium]
MNSPKVRIIYGPILRKEVKPVTVFNHELKELSESMLLVMHKNIGMGLAANQLGEDKNLLVIEYRPAKD